MPDQTPESNEGSPRTTPPSQLAPETVERIQCDIEIENQTDRGAAIIASAMLDDALAEYMKTRMHIEKGSNSKRGTKALFDPHQPLGAFGSRILVAFGMRMISEEIFRDLEEIREVRNKFAHWPMSKGEKPYTPLRFSTPAIRKRCNNLAYPEAHPPSENYAWNYYRPKKWSHTKLADMLKSSPYTRFIYTFRGLILLLAEGRQKPLHPWFTLNYATKVPAPPDTQ